MSGFPEPSQNPKCVPDARAGIGTRSVKVIGKKFGKLTVVGVGRKAKYRCNLSWICRCSCGNESEVRESHLLGGASRSCGHCGKKIEGRHGLSDHPLYRVWIQMIRRCENPNSHKFDSYGARGISVCPEWRQRFLVFFNWAIGSGYRKGLQIDREDNDGNYCPGNCRWVTHRENLMNVRHTNKNNTTGYRGVSLTRNKKKFRASVAYHRKQTSIGVFETAYGAAVARNNYIKDHGLDLPLSKLNLED